MLLRIYNQQEVESLRPALIPVYYNLINIKLNIRKAFASDIISDAESKGIYIKNVSDTPAQGIITIQALFPADYNSSYYLSYFKGIFPGTAERQTSLGTGMDFLKQFVSRMAMSVLKTLDIEEDIIDSIVPEIKTLSQTTGALVKGCWIVRSHVFGILCEDDEETVLCFADYQKAKEEVYKIASETRCYNYGQQISPIKSSYNLYYRAAGNRDIYDMLDVEQVTEQNIDYLEKEFKLLQNGDSRRIRHITDDAVMPEAQPEIQNAKPVQHESVFMSSPIAVPVPMPTPAPVPDTAVISTPAPKPAKKPRKSKEYPRSNHPRTTEYEHDDGQLSLFLGNFDMPETKAEESEKKPVAVSTAPIPAQSSPVVLSDEQQNFIELAKQGYNILVNACIGSGKTTTIQRLCDILPVSKKICYLTYNKLLKVDAKGKIKNSNVLVTNYHGLASMALSRVGEKAGVSDLIQTFIDLQPPTSKFDVLIVDEYQDVDTELSKLLEILKQRNPRMQIIFVGDMHQKIYDKTSLDVKKFAHDFLYPYKEIHFTKCFRLSEDLASALGKIWSTEIVGVNKDCKVEVMSMNEVQEYAAQQEPKDLLCLGQRKGDMSKLLNHLEAVYPFKYNKQTVYASISSNDSGSVLPTSDVAIFTTFDASKGMERPICIVFDFTESYWISRVKQPRQSFEILKNIFCVAASRGKQHIIFVADDKNELVSKDTLTHDNYDRNHYANIDIANMFNFKFKENIEECYSLIRTERIDMDDKTVIAVKDHDGMIDLTPCISIYQKVSFFRNYDIDTSINFHFNVNEGIAHDNKKHKATTGKKILYLTKLQTNQDRYYTQVNPDFISNDVAKQIRDRLSTRFNPNDIVQFPCEIPFMNSAGEIIFKACGLADVWKADSITQLKFCSSLQHENFLECACYMLAAKKSKGYLWNTQNNEMYLVTVPDEKKFLDAVLRLCLPFHP